MKRTWFIALSFILAAFLYGQDNETGESENNIDLDEIAEDIKSLDLDQDNDGPLRAGLELGLPITGITVGYHMTPGMEVNVIAGSLFDFNRLGLGGSVLFNIVNLQAKEQNFPVTLGPVAYTIISTDGIGFSAGGLLRVEYDFSFPLNLYIQSGFIINLVRSEDDPAFNFPFALGARYIF